MKVFKGQIYTNLPSKDSKLYVLRGEIYPVLWSKSSREVDLLIATGSVNAGAPIPAVSVNSTISIPNIEAEAHNSLPEIIIRDRELRLGLGFNEGRFNRSGFGRGTVVSKALIFPNPGESTARHIPGVLYSATIIGLNPIVSSAEMGTTLIECTNYVSIPVNPGLAIIESNEPSIDLDSQIQIPILGSTVGLQAPDIVISAVISATPLEVEALAEPPEVDVVVNPIQRRGARFNRSWFNRSGFGRGSVSGATLPGIGTCYARLNTPLVTTSVDIKEVAVERVTASILSPRLAKTEGLEIGILASVAEVIPPDIFLSDIILSPLPGVSTARVNKGLLTLRRDIDSLEIDGVGLGAYGCYLLRDSRRELLPKRKLRKVSILGRPGLAVLGSRVSSGLIELILAVENKDLLSVKDNLAKIFPLDKVQELRFPDDPNRLYQVKYKGQSNIEEWIQDFIVTIPLILADPYVYSPENILTGPGIIHNQGTEETPLTIEIEGPASDIELFIGENRIKFSGAIGGTERLVIDGAKFEVTLDKKNVLNRLQGNLNPIPPGLIPVSCSSTSVTWRWRNRWVA